jgi:aminopeptidase
VADPRVERYAKLLVGHCLDVRPRQQVLVAATPLARPLVEEVVRAIARCGAWALVRLQFESRVLTDQVWAREAPLELVGELPPVERYLAEHVEAALAVNAPENTRASVDVDGERIAQMIKAAAPLLDRTTAHDLPWVVCQYPTPALAQEAGMALREFEDFLYDACLLDWAAEGARLRRLAERLGGAEELRIVGERTDLTVGIAGRPPGISDGRNNMPGGEVFFSPVEDTACGEIAFCEFPALHEGRELRGIRLRFEDGRVVEASAESGEEFLHEVLDTDVGARGLGELGIGTNLGITRYTKNLLFDEKIAGTVHLALGESHKHIGGRNESAIHWDIVKDLRQGGQLYADGELVQESGRWLS